MRYQICFKRHGGEIYSTADLDAHDDRHAIELARVRFRGGPGNGYEIWQGERHVHTEN
jgi:hypothetical protein